MPGINTIRLVKTFRPLRSMQRIRGLRVLVNHSSHDDRKELEKGRLNDSLRDYDVEPVWNQIRAAHAIDVTCFVT